jgi:hypothetical protein
MITLLTNYRDTAREVSGTLRAAPVEKWPLASVRSIDTVAHLQNDPCV